jgi:hypothetical protein
VINYLTASECLVDQKIIINSLIIQSAGHIGINDGFDNKIISYLVTRIVSQPLN